MRDRLAVVACALAAVSATIGIVVLVCNQLSRPDRVAIIFQGSWASNWAVVLAYARARSLHRTWTPNKRLIYAPPLLAGAIAGIASIMDSSFRDNALGVMGVVNAVPLALVGLIGGCLCAVFLRIVIQNTLRPQGYCGFCGYNLYGLSSTRCPECGASSDTESQ